MATVSLFQRYTQRENHLTNNTLAVLRYLYRTSVRKFEIIMNSLLGDQSVRIGPDFKQQVRLAGSVPDARITQEAINLFIETKSDLALDEGQIERHISGIVQSRCQGAILLALTSGTPDERLRAHLEAKAHDAGIQFRWVSFSWLRSLLESVCEAHDEDLEEVVSDYLDFLDGEGVLTNPGRSLVVVPCGTSFEENKKYALYYNDADTKSYIEADFIGIYTKWFVRFVGQITNVAVCSKNAKGSYDFTNEKGSLTDEQKALILEVIEKTTYYDLASRPHRFYLAPELFATSFKKDGRIGVMKATTLDVGPFLSDTEEKIDAQALARILKGRSFPPS